MISHFSYFSSIWIDWLSDHNLHFASHVIPPFHEFMDVSCVNDPPIFDENDEIEGEREGERKGKKGEEELDRISYKHFYSLFSLQPHIF